GRARLRDAPGRAVLPAHPRAAVGAPAGAAGTQAANVQRRSIGAASASRGRFGGVARSGALSSGRPRAGANALALSGGRGRTDRADRNAARRRFRRDTGDHQHLRGACTARAPGARARGRRPLDAADRLRARLPGAPRARPAAPVRRACEPTLAGARQAPGGGGMTDRARALERLATERFDLLVIGAGILGSRIAYDAARSGVGVALVDGGDFGGATSSASSKLVHGGFQYLARGQVGLVWHAQHERRELMTRIAPHLVRPLPILLAMDRRGSFPRPLVRGGLVLSSLLSGLRERPPRLLDAEHARMWVPPLLAPDGRVYARLPEAQTHDGRLVLATCCAGADAGAVIANHLRVVDLVYEHGRAAGAVVESTLAEGSILIRARALVNATGPWVDRIRQLEDACCRPLVRLSKGTHLVLSLDRPWQAGVAVALDRARLAFALPWQGMLLIGTSDTPYEDDPAAVGPTEAETAELLAHAARLVRPEVLGAGRILHAFSGLRALPTGTGETVTAPREHRLAVGRGGIVSVAGGKLTTHR